MRGLTLAALGTQVSAQGEGAFEALAEVQRLEGLLTRFRPSPLTRLNAAGHLDAPPAELVGAVRHALETARETRGWVTPTVLGALEAAGYTLAPGDSAPAGGLGAVPDVAGIEVTDERITLPAGVRLDLGGTAKSWIAVQAARFLRGPYVLDAGGDVQVRFDRPGTLAVDSPGGEALFLNLPPGGYGVATSSVLRRAWVGGHHLIDPRTGRSAAAAFVQATAVAGAVTRAETLAKLALLGADDVLRDLAGPDAQVLAFDRAGRPHAWRGDAWGRWAA